MMLRLAVTALPAIARNRTRRTRWATRATYVA